MAKYQIEISRTAEKQLKKIATKDQARIAKAILSLGNNPFPVNYKNLKGYTDIYRVRTDSYRIIYQVENNKLLIVILKLGHRKEIYKR